MSDRKLSQLPIGFKPFTDARGDGYEVEYPGVGILKLVRAASIPGTSPRDRGWVAVNFNPDGTPSHANYYPSFSRAARAAGGDS